MSDAKAVQSEKTTKYLGTQLVGKVPENAKITLLKPQKNDGRSIVDGGRMIRSGALLRYGKGRHDAPTCPLFHFIVVIVVVVAFILGVAELQDSVVRMGVGPW